MPSSWAAWSLHLFGSSNLQAFPPPTIPLGCVSSRPAPSRPAPLRSPSLAPAPIRPPVPVNPLWTAPAWPPSRRTPASTRTWTRRPWRRRSGGRRVRLSAPSRTWRRKVWRVAAGRRCCSDCRDNIRSTPRRRSAERTHLSTPVHTCRHQAGGATAQISGYCMSSRVYGEQIRGRFQEYTNAKIIL